jgi:hypothetical protein
MVKGRVGEIKKEEKMAVLMWSLLSSFALILYTIHRHFLKKEKLNAKVCTDWHVAADNLIKYLDKCNSKLDNNLEYKVSNSLEEIDMINPLETITYKNLLREKHRTYIAYIERNNFLVRKEELIGLLKEIEGDEELSQKVMKLIFFTETP